MLPAYLRYSGKRRRGPQNARNVAGSEIVFNYLGSSIGSFDEQRDVFAPPGRMVVAVHGRAGASGRIQSVDGRVDDGEAEPGLTFSRKFSTSRPIQALRG